ncbi:MAG: GIY-YIG nuclease family protein [Chitinispirillales bacterium]|jgi:hypothetical protein|nr:GIY-YIG nuclease family protein [Chitinispirillales bacterium]
MDNGWVYVVHNGAIKSLKAKDGRKTYKIGITTTSVTKRYYGLGLKMPGEFFCEFAYMFDNGQHGKVETMLKNRFNQFNDNGEWFYLNDNELNEIHSVCKEYGGVLDTDTIQKQITEKDSIPTGITFEEWVEMPLGKKAAIKARVKRKINKQQKEEIIHEKRRQAGLKAWDTRRKKRAKEQLK